MAHKATTPPAAQQHRWAFIDSRGRHRGAISAATKKEAIATFETNRYGESTATAAKPMGRLTGWTVLDRGIRGGPPPAEKRQTTAKVSERRAPTFPLQATDGRVYRFRLNGETLRPVM